MTEKHKKRKPRTILTHRHDGGGFSHEHIHDDGKVAKFAGTSQTIEDVKQHMDDHMGGADEAEGAPAEAAAPADAAPGGE